jgi:hypothetical protein
MLRIYAVDMPAVAKPGKNGLSFVDWNCKRRGIKVSLPRKTLGIPILDDERLTHSTVSATNPSLRVIEFDSPDMTATVTYRFVLFHRISVSALY